MWVEADRVQLKRAGPAPRRAQAGSGQGSIPTGDILAELPDLASEIASGTFQIDTRAVPLSDVETAWTGTDSSERIVVLC